MKSSISRITLLFFPVILAELLLVVFVGVGYSVLTLFLFHAAAVMSIYSPKIYMLFLGKEQYSSHANSLAKVRRSRAQMLGLIFNSAVLLALAVWIILIANLKLIDYI
jgi:hypothetical protein